MPIKVRERITDSDTDRSAAEAVRGKVSRLLGERTSLYGQLNVNTQQLRDAVAAGRLFGIEIDVPREFLRDQSQPPAPAATQASLFEPSGDMTIREAVLDQLKMAGDKGMKAGPLRRIIENMIGRQLHYKTVGMTLYRLSEKGLVRRIGFVWYATAAAQTKTPAS
jgi:hypothetical protein